MINTKDIVADLARTAVPVKPAQHPFALSLRWIVTATVYLTASLMLSGLRPDLPTRLYDPWFAIEIGLLLVLFISTAVSSALLAFPDIHQKRNLAVAPVWIFALFLLTMLLALALDKPGIPLPTHNLECTLNIAAIAIPPAAWIFFSIRKLASTHRHLAGSTALLCAFSLGALWLRLYEVTNSHMHIIMWHYLPLIAACLAGGWLGKRLLNW